MEVELGQEHFEQRQWPCKEPEVGTNLACLRNSLELLRLEQSKRVSKKLRSESSECILTYPFLSSISFLLPWATLAICEDNYGHENVSVQRILRDCGVQAFHFTDDKTEAPEGSDDFPRTTRQFESSHGEETKLLAHALYQRWLNQGHEISGL